MNHSMNPFKVTALPVKTHENLENEQVSHDRFITDLKNDFGPDGNAIQEFLDSHAQESEGQ